MRHKAYHSKSNYANQSQELWGDELQRERRRLSDQRSLLGADLSHTPAWHILITLLALGGNRKAQPLNAIWADLQLPGRTLERWIEVMAERDLLTVEVSAFGRAARLTEVAMIDLELYFKNNGNIVPESVPSKLDQDARWTLSDLAIGSLSTGLLAVIFAQPTLEIFDIFRRVL